MVEIIRIPKLGLSDYAQLVSWEFDVGDPVKEAEIIAVLESDKASAEIESPTDGILLETYVGEGEEVAVDVGEPLGAIGSKGESAPSFAELKGGSQESGSSSRAPTSDSGTSVESTASSESPADRDSPAGEVKATPRAKRRASEVKADVDIRSIDGSGPQGAVTEDDIERILEETGTDRTETDDRTDIKATPRAKRKAEENDVDLLTVEGTGPEGAIVEDDVVDRIKEPSNQRIQDVDQSSSEDLTVTESNELTGTRKTIAERLGASAREKPHVMGTREIEIGRLEDLHDHIDEKYEVDVSLNDLLLYFVGEVLEDLPEFNAHFEDDRHKLIDEINVGYAVDGPRGLTVPVVENVDKRSLSDLARHKGEKVRRVLDDEHTPEDLVGGTFTVTNVGVFGMDISYSIINPPEVAILAFGRRKFAPVEDDGQVEFRKVITCSLTIDHRVLDGADSGAFLERLAEYVEYPGTVLSDVS